MNVVDNGGGSNNNGASDQNFGSMFDVVENYYGDSDYMNKYMSSRQQTDAYDISSRLFNYPYHLLPSVDIPINSKIPIGRKFMENISSNARIIYMTPGSSDYLPSANDKTKSTVASLLAGGSSSGDDSALKALREKGLKGKYFEFRNDYPTYMRYVNILCRAMAIYLGIGDRVGPDGKTPYKHYCWQNYRYSATSEGTEVANSVFNDAADWDELKDMELDKYVQNIMFSDWQYTLFYADNNTNFQESFSNSTMESKLKGMLDAGSSMMKELSFLMNAGGIDASDFNDKVNTTVDELVSRMSKKDGIMSRITDAATSVFSGHQLIFPQMWSSSDNDKTYSLSFNLAAPYGDTESVYVNSWVALFHLLPYVLPKQTKNSPNSVSSPFLIRAFSRGWFTCQMGIVQSMTIDRGDVWNVNGLPTHLRVTMYIRDLYSDLSISPSNRPVEFFSNQSLLDFLAVSCGLNLAKPNFVKQIDLIKNMLQGSVLDIPDNLYAGFINNVRKVSTKLFNTH